ncbi:MAG: hypothetical protein GX548_03795 [Lentisphaerae bacterium]|nr:hypothetical protein [Lentisphaerota bacterium]
MAILLAILLLVALIYAPIWDTAPPDVADLVVVRTEVPPEENAYTYFLQATSALRRIDGCLLSQYRQGLTNDEAAVSAVLATNQAAIARIKLGVEQPFCQKPVIEKWTPFIFANVPISDFLEIGRLLETQARYERMQGRMREATDAALLLMRYGSRLQQAADLIIEHLVASGGVGMGLGQAEDLARDKRCGAAERERLAAALAELESAATGLANVTKGESIFLADMLRQYESGAASRHDFALGLEPGLKRLCLSLLGRALVLPSYCVQYNRTQHWIVGDYRLLTAHASSTYADHPLRGKCAVPCNDVSKGCTCAKAFRRPPSHETGWPFANALGVRIWRAQARTLDSVVRNTCRLACHLSATRLLLACRAYEEATGHLPETLEELVPDYLPAIPRDPFDGQPFRYSAERRLVYSVGENLADDGGTNDDRLGRWWNAKDLVFNLFVHEPEPPAE